MRRTATHELVNGIMRAVSIAKHSDARYIRLRLIALIRLYQLLAYACMQLHSWTALAICLAIGTLVAMSVFHLRHLLSDELILAIGVLLLLQLVACILIKLIPTAFKWVSPLKAAFELECHFESLRGRVASGIELAMRRVHAEGVSERLIQAAIADSLSGLLSVRWYSPLLERFYPAMKGMAIAAMLWCAALLWASLSHTDLQDLVMPFITAHDSVAFSRHGKLAIEPLPNAVLKGSNITVRAVATGGVPREVCLKVTGKMTKHTAVLMMHLKALSVHLLQPALFIWRNRRYGALTYEVCLRNLREDTIIVAQSGNVRSKAHLIRVVDFPTIKSITLLIEPPLYTGLEVRELSLSAPANLSIPYGSLVSMTVICNNRLKSAVIHPEGDSAVTMSVNGNVASALLEMRRSMRIGVTVRDIYGSEGQWGKVSLAVVHDKPPVVEILSPTESEVRVLPVASVPIVVQASDDYGLGNLKVTFVGNVPVKREVELGSYGGSEKEATANLLMHIVGLRVGSIIRFRALASDNDELLGPKVGCSAWRTVRVVTLNEFLSEFEGLERKACEVLHDAASEYESALNAIERAMKILAHRPLSRGELSKLQAAVERLSELKREFEQLSSEVSSKVDMAHLNQVASPIDWLDRMLRQYLLNRLDSDIEALKRLEVAALRGAPNEALSRLSESAHSSVATTMSSIEQASRALQRARRFSELFKLALGAAEVSKSICEVKRRVELLPNNELSSRMSQLRQSVAAAEARIQWIRQRMRAVASEWRGDGEGDLASILMRANDELPIEGVKSALANAIEAMQHTDLSAVSQSLSALHQAVQKFSEDVFEAYERVRLHAYRSDRDRLAQVWRRVEKLLNDQRELAHATEMTLKFGREAGTGLQREGEGEGNETQLKQREGANLAPEELIERQGRLVGQAQPLPKQVSELLGLIPQLDHGVVSNATSALMAMRSSLSHLRKRNLASASRAQANAISALEALSNALSNVFRYDYGVASQLAGIAQMEMIDLALLQESINLRSKDAIRFKSADNEALRKLMAVQERMIRSALKRADNLFGVPWSAELRELVHAAQTDAAEVATAIERGSIDSTVRQKQERILLTLLRLANELSGTHQAMQAMQQRLAGQREGEGMKRGGQEGKEDEDGGKKDGWRNWLRSLPGSVFGKFIEHGPPMKSVPEALVMHRAQVTEGTGKGAVKGTAQPMPHSQEAIAPATYRNAITIYFKRVGSR